ncbi:MAG: ABC transporter permease subunit, partial [Isosphaeraceae bacterium]
ILFRLLAVTTGLAIAIPLAKTTWNYAVPAFEELRLNGYGSAGVTAARDELNEFLRLTMVCLYMLMAVGLATGTASSVTSEKEKGTWISLLASPMEAEEILVGKLTGALGAIRWLALAYLSLLSLGLASGSIHPLAGCYSAVLTMTLMCSVGGLGLLFSMFSRSSARALSATILTLLAVNTLPILCVSGGPGVPITLVSVSPLLVGFSLASFEDLDRSSFMSPLRPQVLALLVSGLILHMGAAWALWKACVEHFDVAADRPRLGSSSELGPARSTQPSDATDRVLEHPSSIPSPSSTGKSDLE